MADTQRKYIGARYVPLIMGEWDSSVTYEPLSVVLHEGNSYTSRTFVPAGTPIDNDVYWALSGTSSAGVEVERQQRINSDVALQTDIGNEALARIAADVNLQTQINTKLDKPTVTGENGQILTYQDGATEWSDVGTPTDAQVESAVSDWLDDHPEATTTVEDGSITNEKLVQSGGVLSDVENIKMKFSKMRDARVYGNLWDEDTKAYGYFSTSAGYEGDLVEGGTAWYYSATYIPVKTGDLILYNNSRPIVCAYDADGAVVECTQPSWSGYTVPANVAYLRFSVNVTGSVGMCIFVDGTSQAEYKSKTKLYAPGLVTGKPTVIVSETVGVGDYTSLTRALYETYEDSPDVLVLAGTYDIVAEYKALFGATIFDTMTYETAGMKNFQWGLFIDNRVVRFASDARVICDMSAYTNDGTRRFSPFNLGENAVLDGCNCYAVNPYYVIHDDFGYDTTQQFTNIIKNCVLISPEPANGNIIGGGMKRGATKIVDNCYLDNGNNRPVTMRYHNTNYANAKPLVIIKNTRANKAIRINCYGSQTAKMVAIVNNCQASIVEKAYEGDASIDNVDLYEWCNIVSS